MLTLSFGLFVFSIPFESLDVGIFAAGAGFLSVPRVLGVLFFGIALLAPRVTLKRLPPTLGLFAVYLICYVVIGLTQDARFQSAVLSRFVTLLQLLILYCIACNLFQRERLASFFVLTLALCCVLFVVLQHLGVIRSGTERIAVMGTNPNRVGFILGIGLVSTFGYILASPVLGPLQQICCMCLAALLFLPPIVATGSRTALFALSAGMTFLALWKANAWYRLRRRLSRRTLIVLLSATFIGGSYSVVSYEPTRERFRQFFEENRMAGRERLWPAALAMFKESPLTGWGPVRNWTVLGAKLRAVEGDAHNLYLFLLIEVGLVGAIPFYIALGLCCRSAWRSRQGPKGILPAALTAMLVVENLGGVGITDKLFWLLLAYGSANMGLRRGTEPDRFAFGQARRINTAPTGVVQCVYKPTYRPLSLRPFSAPGQKPNPSVWSLRHLLL
jgi:O-antigen ligase